MVGAGKEKLCSAGDGAEFPDGQFVPVDGVVVEYVVGLKVRGVVDKVVVHGVFAHGDIGICDHRFQVNGLPVPGAGVNFLLWNRHQKTS